VNTILKAEGEDPTTLISIPNYSNVKRHDMTDELAARKFNDYFRMYFKLQKLGMDLVSLPKIV
jgi:hypothetical protein